MESRLIQNSVFPVLNAIFLPRQMKSSNGSIWRCKHFRSKKSTGLGSLFSCSKLNLREIFLLTWELIKGSAILAKSRRILVFHQLLLPTGGSLSTSKFSTTSNVFQVKLVGLIKLLKLTNLNLGSASITEGMLLKGSGFLGV